MRRITGEGRNDVAQSIRCFIAVPLDEGVISSLAAFASRVRELLPASLRWVAPEAMHITVKFLGDVPAGQLQAVTDVASRAASGADPFALAPVGLDAFPSPVKPQTLVVSLDDSEGRLAKVAREVEKGVEPLGYPREGRRFRAHLTLARARRDERVAPIGPMLRQVDTVELREVWVDRLWVVQSELRPGGPVYTPMAQLPFASGLDMTDGRRAHLWKGAQATTEEDGRLG